MSEGQVDTLYIDIQARLDGFEERMREVESRAEEAGENAGSGFSGKFSAGLTIATTGALALAGALVAVGAGAFSMAQEAEQNVDNFQSKLGASRAEAEALGKVAEEVFGDNWTGSLTEAADAVATVRKEIKGLTTDELRGVTGGVVAISETFEQEQGAVAAAVQSLMKSTGASAQEAMDFITKGFQKGLDSSGDFLDTLNEYGPQFEKSGISAEKLFSLLESGAAKGALGTDKIADAFKEFGLTVTEVSKESSETYHELGLNHQKIVDDINSGKMTTAEAFELVTQKLQAVKGVANQTRIGAAVFGGAGEDMAAGIKNIDLTKTKLDDLKGATDSLNQRYTSFGDLTTGMWRKVQLALLPVGKELLGMANEAVPYLTRAFDQVATKLPGMIKAGIDSVKQFGTAAVNVYNTVRPALDATAAGVQKLSSFLERNKEIVIPLATAVTAMAGAYGVYRAAVLAATLATTAMTAAKTAATTAAVALRAAITFMTGPIGIAITVIGLLVAAGVYLYRNWDTVKAKAIEVWGGLKSIVASAMSSIVEFLRGIDLKALGLDIVRGLANGILAGPALVLNAARGLGNAVISGIKGVLNIQSPSRVMRELGEFTGQGFVDGLNSSVPSIKKAAQDTAKAFAAGLAEFKLEKDIGKIDLTSYTKTLTDAAATLRAKLGTVKEGSEAYSLWLKQLVAVQKELDGVKGKSGEQQVATKKTAVVMTEAAKAAKEQADAIKRGQAQIANRESMEAYVTGLRSATKAQLDHALQLARSRGETEKYSAIRAELDRRADASKAAQDKVAEATRKAAEAAKQQREEIAQNRDQILKSEAWEKYVAGLKSASNAQLEQSKAAALAGGETEKYNAIKGEQKRRIDAVSDAQNKAAEAARKEAEAVASGRKAIADNREWDSYISSLSDLTDQELALEAARQEAAGHQQQYNAVLAEQRDRAKEAAQAVSDLVDAEIRAANVRFADTQGATDSAYRQSYGVGDEGLVTAISALGGLSVEAINADIGAALADLERWNKSAADTIKRVYADALAERAALATKEAAASQRAIEMAAAERAAVVAKYQAEEAAAEDALVTEEYLISQMQELVNQGRDPGQTGFLEYLKKLAEGSGQAAVAAQAVIDKFDQLRFRQQTDAGVPVVADVAARGTRTPVEATTASVEARGALTAEALAWKAKTEAQEASRVATEKYRASLKGKTLAELEGLRATALAIGNAEHYAALSQEIKDKTDSLTNAKKLMTDVQASLNKEAANVGGHYDQIKALELLRGQAEIDQVQLEKLIQTLTDLDKESAKTEGIKKAAQALGEIGGKVGQVGDIFSKAFGDDSGAINYAVKYAAGGLEIFGKFLTGDFVGMAQAAVAWVENIFQAVDNLVPGIREWKKSLLEVADAEKKVAGAATGMFKNVYAEVLGQDAANRTQLATMNPLVRFFRGIFGGLPTVLTDETAKLKIAAGEIFAEFATTISGSLDSALMNAFEEGSFKGTEQAMEKSMNSLLAKMTLKALVMASGLEKQIQDYAEARARALEDGAITASEQMGLDTLWNNILGGQRRVMSDWQAIAPTLPGYGQNATAQAPANSIASLQQQMSDLQNKLNLATTDADRTNLRAQIDTLQRELDRMQSREASDALKPITSTAGTVTGSTAQISAISASVTQTLDLSGLTALNTTLVAITPRWESLTTRFEGAVARFDDRTVTATNWANQNRQ